MTPSRWFACIAVTVTMLLVAAFVNVTTPVVAAAPVGAAAVSPLSAQPSAAQPAAALQRAATPRPSQSPQPAAAAQPPAAGEYAGESTCLTCHEDQAYKGTAHARAFNDRTPAAGQGCESCHGPGKAHAESGDPTLIGRFDQMSASEASAACTTCHNKGGHALWDGSAHDQRNVSCTSCHSVHNPQGEPQLKAESQMALCSTCHRSITNKQHRFAHMPVREGGMTCSSCHNVHGSTNVRMLKAGTTIDESCTSCHTDKRGPFLWDHAPVSESCITCHDPHGSNNERMLVSRQPFLCQRCHVTSRHPPTIYEGYLLNNTQNANKIYGRSCTVCHQMVHGSNAPSGKALLR